ncbi:GntR family transcriptional regulator [Streptomyces albidoflavus]
MAPEIERARAMYVQVADVVGAEITSGKYAPGSLLPSEREMMLRFGISKATVRSALERLKTMGLIQSRQGVGSVVLEAPGQGVPALDRSARRAGGGWRLPELHELEEPKVSRAILKGVPARYLELEDQDAIIVDRLMSDESIGRRITSTTYIPLATAAESEEIATDPQASMNVLLNRLNSIWPLNITDYVSARAPFPDETAALRITELGPILTTYRVVADAESGKPLVCEELKASAASLAISYPVGPAVAKRPK